MPVNPALRCVAPATGRRANAETAMRDPAITRMRASVAWLAIALCVLAPSAFAADQSNALDLRQLIARAQCGNKDLQAARYAIDIARARLLQAGLRPNPRLDVSARSDFLFGNEGEYGTSVGISQQFPIAGRILRQKDVARVDIALAQAEVEEAERKLAGEIAADAYRLIIVDRQIQSRDALIGIEKKLARTTRDRFKAAEVSELDVNTVRLDVQRLEQERALLQNQRAALQASLDTRLGRATASPILLDEPIPSLDALPAPALLQAKALALRPDYRSALLGADRAQAEQALAHALRWDDWTVGLELSQDRQVITGAPPQASNRAIGVTVSIPLPWINQGQGLLAEAQASQDQAQARIDALRLGIGNEIAGAQAEAARLQASLRQYTNGILPVSQGNVRLAQQGYSQGLIPVFDVVQAQRQQAELNATYLGTLDQYLQALVRLHTAVGDYLPAPGAEGTHPCNP
jgi:cobalt-zinc-cadmium efflux system outer membrane protein